MGRVHESSDLMSMNFFGPSFDAFASRNTFANRKNSDLNASPPSPVARRCNVSWTTIVPSE